MRSFTKTIIIFISLDVFLIACAISGDKPQHGLRAFTTGRRKRQGLGIENVVVGTVPSVPSQTFYSAPAVPQTVINAPAVTRTTFTSSPAQNTFWMPPSTEQRTILTASPVQNTMWAPPTVQRRVFTASQPEPQQTFWSPPNPSRIVWTSNSQPVGTNIVVAPQPITVAQAPQPITIAQAPQPITVAQAPVRYQPYQVMAPTESFIWQSGPTYTYHLRQIHPHHYYHGHPRFMAV